MDTKNYIQSTINSSAQTTYAIVLALCPAAHALLSFHPYLSFPLTVDLYHTHVKCNFWLMLVSSQPFSTAMCLLELQLMVAKCSELFYFINIQDGLHGDLLSAESKSE